MLKLLFVGLLGIGSWAVPVSVAPPQAQSEDESDAEPAVVTDMNAPSAPAVMPSISDASVVMTNGKSIESDIPSSPFQNMEGEVDVTSVPHPNAAPSKPEQPQTLSSSQIHLPSSVTPQATLSGPEVNMAMPGSKMEAVDMTVFGSVEAGKSHPESADSEDMSGGMSEMEMNSAKGHSMEQMNSAPKPASPEMLVTVAPVKGHEHVQDHEVEDDLSASMSPAEMNSAQGHSVVEMNKPTTGPVPASMLVTALAVEAVPQASSAKGKQAVFDMNAKSNTNTGLDMMSTMH